MPGMNNQSQPKATTHMTFFWGKNSLILFTGWPGTRTGMYVLALVVVFLLAVMVEWISHYRRIRKLVQRGDNVSGGVIRTVVHGIRMGLCYLDMLAVMSFNGGVFIVAVAGHAFGFFLFGSRVFDKSDDLKKDNPPAICSC